MSTRAGQCNIGTVEIVCTYRCNLSCPNCWALCPSAPYRGDLTAIQVKGFLDEWEAKGHIFGLVTVTGGEPSITPDIMNIVKVVREYQIKHKSEAWLLTNYSLPEIRLIIEDIKATGMHIGISDKTKIYPTYRTVMESPTDLDLPHDIGCFQTTQCGCSFNYLGLYPCSPMAAAARVFDYKPANSFDDFQGMLEQHCKHCGLSVDRPRAIKKTMTKTWQERLKSYSNKRKAEQS